MENIKVLRKKQFIYTNIIVVLCIILLFFMLNNLKSYVYYYSLIGGLSLLSGLYHLLSVKYNLSVFEWSRKLQEYERKKLGNEWKKTRKFSGVFSLLLGVYFIWQGTSSNDNDFDFTLDGTFLNFYLIMSFAILFILNLSVYLKNQKLDRVLTTVPKGYTFKQIALGIVLGLALSVISITYILWKLS